MLRTYPHGEDHAATAGGDTAAKLPALGRPLTLNAEARPPGEDGTTNQPQQQNLELEAQAVAEAGAGDLPNTPPPVGIDFLSLVRQAEDQAQLYIQQVNRKAWSQSYRAFHQEHYIGSKYTRPDWRGRSKLFVPKTRAAVRKDNASVAASLFNSIDAINCLPGDEGDPHQRGAAALMQSLVNYRVGGRAPGRASLPWFLVSMGARQDAVLTGVCVSKQYWLQTHRKTHEEPAIGEDGARVTREHYVLDTDRPDILLFPPENVVIDSAADWRNPAQSASFLMLKYPMQIEEIKAKQNSPVNPWKEVREDVLRGATESGKFDMAAIRRARELGLDRYDETQTGTHFQVIWVYETFVRVDGEDWCFYSVGDRAFLTDPRPTREVYPEQNGERPVAFGYGNLESHRIFPMAPVESWQPLQMETNDLRNLLLDAIKQNVMPITKVVRGRNIDLNQVQRRSAGSAIIVQQADDVTFETPAQVPQTATEMTREIDLEFDDLAGQQNYGTVETNNALGKTLGGLKLAAGAANAVQEFDIRVWIETWANQALQQVVRLEQWYEEDAQVLGIAGANAQLWVKHGISQINDELLSHDVTVRVSVGLGAGDPAQRLAKFAQATEVVAPIIQQSPEFQSGQKEINVDAIIEEVYGAVGYKDAGKRFFKDNGQPRPNPMADLQTKKLQAEIEQRQRQGKGSLLGGLAQVAKVALGRRDLEAETIDMLLGHQQDAHERGFDHAERHNRLHLDATDLGHRHGHELSQHHHQRQQDHYQRGMDAAQQAGGDAELDAAASPAPPSGAAPSGAAPQAQPSASPPTSPDLMTLLRNGQIEFTRGADGRINGVKTAGKKGYPAPAGGR